MFCISCGSKLPSDAAFCPTCGQKVGSPKPEDEMQSDGEDLSDASESGSDESEEDDSGVEDDFASEASEVDDEESSDDNEEVIATLDYEEDSDKDYCYHLMLTQERLKGSYLWHQEKKDGSTINTEAQIDIPLYEVRSISFAHKRERWGKQGGWFLGIGLGFYFIRKFIDPKFLGAFFPELPVIMIGIGILSAIGYVLWGHSYYVSLKSMGDELSIPVPKSCCDNVRDFIESVKEAKAKYEE